MLTGRYNAMTQSNCFIKGSHKYDIYLADKNKAHINFKQRLHFD